MTISGLSPEEPSEPSQVESDEQYEICTGIRPESHTMGASLRDYILPKVHDSIIKSKVELVVVDPQYLRTDLAQPSSTEKRDKRFKWQRSTASERRYLPTSLEVHLHCFPGKDYVRHYAGLVAAYFKFEKRDVRVVYRLPTPSECMEPLTKSNLRSTGQVGTVIVGYVDRLVESEAWDGYDPEKHIFAWQKEQRDGKTVAYLGCLISFWGDISGNLVSAFNEINKIKRVIYIGKARTLTPDVAPNEWLTTGNRSILEGRLVRWHEILTERIWLPDNVRNDLHCTTWSPLCETNDWLYEQTQLGYTSMDCEVGHMAQACNEHGIEFAYLHLVSHNTAVYYLHNLAHERREEIIDERRQRLPEIISILRPFLASQGSIDSAYA